jgi:hypothetical protein
MTRHRAPEPPERVTLAVCIACGALGTADACTGECADHRIELVRGGDFDMLQETAAWAERLAELVEEVAAAAPPDGDWERAWQGWERSARDLLAAAPAGAALEPDERVGAWWCATCGRIEAPQECLGVCIRRPQEFVTAGGRASLAGRAVAADRLRRLVRILAWFPPGPGEWERRARRVQGHALSLRQG